MNKISISKLLIATTILFTCIVNSIAQKKRNFVSLETIIKKKLLSTKGDFAVAYKNLNTNELLQINALENFHAASTMKTPVMLEVYKQVKAGNLKLTDSILIINEFKSIVDGSPYKMDLANDSDDVIYNKIGKKMSIYELVYQMITVSSNLATNILIEKVGANNTTTSMHKLGAKKIKVLRGVEDTKAFNAGLNNTTTANDLMLIFEKIAQNNLFDKKENKEIIRILLDQKFNEIIPAKLPKEVKVAHKTGSINGVQHDSGIVYLPNGNSYVLVLLSKNLVDEKRGVKVLSEVSELIYKYTVN